MSSLQQLVDQGILDPDFLSIGEAAIGQVDDVRPPSPKMNPHSSPVVSVSWHNQGPVSAPDPVQHQSTGRLDDFQDVKDLSYYNNSDFFWLYSGRSQGWWLYAENENEELEKQYKSGGRSCDLIISGRSYHFNFSDMTQSSGHSSRNILRIETLKDVALRGIAGTRIEKAKLCKPQLPDQSSQVI